KTIIHLQALLGNRWAAISSYLPHRTDNDIKNYWNTHLNKKLNLQRQNGITNEDSTNMTEMSSCDNKNSYNKRIINKGQWEIKLQTDINMAKQALFQALSLGQPSSSTPLDPDSPKPHDHHSTTATYASSTDNISKLLQNWTSSSSSMPNTSSLSNNRSSSTGEGGLLDHHSLFSSNSESGSVDEKLNLMTNTSIFKGESKSNADMEATNNATNDDHGSLSLIEQWLFDDQGLVDQCVDDQEDLIDVSLEGKNNGR
ncbi:unnamed protein product, partial [Eruca vesicaria subsp. sativa]|nr:unnamed protein product [Eruca vesicaria subsp. sativa]